MTTKNQITLYIGTHNITGLKYFGKTTKYHTQEDLQKYYHGSGKYWLDHLKIHCDNVTMEVYGTYDISEVEEIALKFSEDNNIVKALNENGKKVWANEKPENGLDGGNISDKTKYKISLANKGYVTAKDSNNNIVRINKTDFDLNDNLVGVTKGSLYGKFFKLGYVTAKDSNNNIVRINKTDFDLNDNLVGVTKGRKDLKSVKKAKSDFGKTQTGYKNSRALYREIYNQNKELVYIVEGNLRNVLEKYTLPRNLLNFTEINTFKSKQLKHNKFSGWYIKTIKRLKDM